MGRDASDNRRQNRVCPRAAPHRSIRPAPGVAAPKYVEWATGLAVAHRGRHSV